MNAALVHYYRAARAWQIETYGNSNLYVNGRDLRQFTGGGAWYGEHALAAYEAARREINFRKRMEKYAPRPAKRGKLS